MAHQPVLIKVSSKQMSKLRNGHKVRVKPPTIEGEGVCLIVHPNNYSLISKTFNKNKGVEISLSPDELVANKSLSPEQHKQMKDDMGPVASGSGIFGKTFDRGVRKVLGKEDQQTLYKYAKDVLNPMAKASLIAGLATGATALGTTNPALIPYLPAGVASLSFLGTDYLDNPSKYQGKNKVSGMAKEYARDQALGQLNEQLGTNMGNLSRASVANALQNKLTSDLNQQAVEQLYYNPIPTVDKFNFLGQGLYAGKGFVSNIRRTGGQVGLQSGLINTRPPALQSQPFSANFQFQHTLPPAYQQLHKGSGLYA